MLLNLIKINDLPNEGKHPGTFLDAVRASGKDEDGKDFDNLVVTVELDATDKAGKRWRLEKVYSLDGRARGLGVFRKEYRSAFGRKLKDQELAAFDADALLKGQRATFVIKHKKNGKGIVAVIDTILPAPAPTPSND